MILTNRDKYNVLAKEPEQIKEFLSDELFKIGRMSLTNEQLDAYEKAFIDNVVIEVEELEENENVKTSLRMMNGRVVVIKTKKLSIMEMIGTVLDITSIVGQSQMLIVIGSLLCLASLLFTTKLDDNEETIYAYLVYLYFVKHNKISNTEIYQTIKLYYKNEFEETIPDRKIEAVLKKLEDDLRVIEFVDGYLVVKDKIYFD